MSRRAELYAKAAHAGLAVETWTPGDGFTRYRFFWDPDPKEENADRDYFSSGSAIYTALGMKEAHTFLNGVRAAQRRHP